MFNRIKTCHNDFYSLIGDTYRNYSDVLIYLNIRTLFFIRRISNNIVGLLNNMAYGTLILLLLLI
jgi:hypothetical protein